MSELQQIDILLAEDNAKDAEMTQRALRKHNLGNRLYWVKDGAEALDYLFRRGEFAGRDSANPAVILLDLKMPKVDGLEVLRQVKGDDRLKVIPVVVMTSSREDQDIVDSYRLGVNAYIVKPLNFHEFVDAMKIVGAFWVVLNEPPKGGTTPP